MDWTLTLTALAVFGALTVFAAWKSGRPRKDTLRVQWISWPVVTIFAATAAIFAIIHMLSLLGVQTGSRVVPDYPR